MLGWIGAVCVLLLVATFWPMLKRLGSFLRGPEISRGQRSAPKCAAGTDPGKVSEAAGESSSSSSSLSSSSSPSSASVPIAFICKPSALAKYLLKHCASFCKYLPYPAWHWRASACLQTVWGALWPHDCAVLFIRDYLQLSDDGLVALDWAVVGPKRRRTSSNSSCPILLIIPNSFGKLTRNVLKLCETALSHGYLPVVFNRRSQNGTPLSTIKLQEFGDPADLREAVRYIRYRQPVGLLYAVSESTGSGLLLSYLGECGSSSYMTAAACLSPIFRCQSWFESGPGWPFHWVLLLYQKVCLSRYRTVLGELVHIDSLFSSRSLRAMEETLFCQSGLKEAPCDGAWEAYWERNDALRDVDEVAIPVLCVCSRDDPIRGETRATLPLELFESNPHFFLLLTESGGHCGFSTADEGPMLWSHQVLLEFFRATSDFFAAEERAKLNARRRGVSMSAKAFRHRSVSTYKRLPVCSHNIHTIYNWQRSYTR